MPRIRREVILISLQHFIAPALDLLPCLQAWGTRDCIKGSKVTKREGSTHREGGLYKKNYKFLLSLQSREWVV